MAFVDEARIQVQSGEGGRGCESFHQEKYWRKPRPDGGDGGRGGDVIFQASRSIQTLLDFKFKQHYKAGRGGHGGSRGKSGKRGENCILRVPMGTIVKDAQADLIIKDLVEDGQQVVVVHGGAGGIGNQHNHTPQLPGSAEQKIILLELKMIADVGLIGFPNAGKSTIISAISKVKSKIANYPFTTKQPVLGIVKDEIDEDLDFVVADLPGIIENAHKGKGLGDRFLRHAERTKILVHVLDMAATEGRDPLDDFEKLNYELEQYSGKVSLKHKLVVANKMDMPAAAQHLRRFQAKHKEDIIAVSALEKRGLDVLIAKIKEELCRENFRAE